MKRELWYKVTVRDRDGKIISHEKRKSRSFLNIWNRVVAAQMLALSFPGSQMVKDINGNSWPLGCGDSGSNFRMDGPANNDDWGVVIGTSNTPVSISDYAMGSQITQGTGAGQMDHLVNVINASVVADPNCSFLISRSFANNSGELITVKESGIYIIMERSLSPFSTAFGCGVRDVFSTPQDVPDGGGITVEYTLRVTE